jgi:hypothetical protein
MRVRLKVNLPGQNLFSFHVLLFRMKNIGRSHSGLSAEFGALSNVICDCSDGSIAVARIQMAHFILAVQGNLKGSHQTMRLMHTHTLYI